MQMTRDEIVRDYNAAMNKRKQIGILAELNCVSPGEICAELTAAGLQDVEVPNRGRRKKAADVPPMPPEAHGSASPESAEAVQGPGGEGRASRKDSLESSPSVYGRIEVILEAVPGNASPYVRNTAKELVSALFREYVEQRMALDREESSESEGSNGHEQVV